MFYAVSVILLLRPASAIVSVILQLRFASAIVSVILQLRFASAITTAHISNAQARSPTWFSSPRLQTWDTDRKDAPSPTRAKPEEARKPC